ncbi:MAG: hypothetical protein ACRDUW_03415 [Pseudonocardiaceae bacterium]
MFMELPRWAMLGVVAAGGLVGWYIYKAASAPSTTPPTWEQNARNLLTARGYPSSDIESALSNYQGGGTMSPMDLKLIAEVIRAIGTPDMPTAAVDSSGINPTSVVPDGGLTTTDPSAASTVVPDNSTAGYWYVISLGYGWSSTLRGISQQFYGDTTHSTMLLQLNPGTTTSDYARIPPGVKIKIPRSLTV